MKYVSADMALKIALAVNHRYTSLPLNEKFALADKNIEDLIRLKSVDIERKTAEWEDDNGNKANWGYCSVYCNHCGRWSKYPTNYCGYCGSEMNA